MKIFRFMVSFVFCAFFAVQAFAHSHFDITHPGFYLGVGAGYSDAGYKNNFAPGYTAASVDKAGLATQIEVGYDFVRHFGALMGIIYFHKPEFRNINGVTDSKIKNNLVFFALRGIVPFTMRLALFVNAGVGYIARSHLIVGDAEVFTDRLIVRPVYGLGLGYELWRRWVVTLSWLQAPCDSSQLLPTVNYAGLGVRYKFSS